jgi:hypothetical protein
MCWAWLPRRRWRGRTKLKFLNISSNFKTKNVLLFSAIFPQLLNFKNIFAEKFGEKLALFTQNISSFCTICIMTLCQTNLAFLFIHIKHCRLGKNSAALQCVNFRNAFYLGGDSNPCSWGGEHHASSRNFLFLLSQAQPKNAIVNPPPQKNLETMRDQGKRGCFGAVSLQRPRKWLNFTT